MLPWSDMHLQITVVNELVRNGSARYVAGGARMLLATMQIEYAFAIVFGATQILDQKHPATASPLTIQNRAGRAPSRRVS